MRSLRVVPWHAALVAGTVLMTLGVATPAHAQFGKLKKLGADAIKDAAKEKLGTDKKDATKPAATGAKAGGTDAGRPKLDDDHIALVLASLEPQMRDAQARDAAARAEVAWKQKVKERDACMARLQQNPDPAKIMAAAQKNEARIRAVQTQAEGVQKRYSAALEANDRRRQVFLQDSLNALTIRSAVLTMDGTCVVEPTPAVLLEAQYRRSTETASSDGFDPGDAVRGVVSRYAYGVLRERIALWALSQEDPNLKGLGQEGVFTAEEQAALTKHAASIAKLTPLFKSDAMIWKTWSDLRDW